MSDADRQVLDRQVADRLARLPEWADERLVERGRFLTVACLVGTTDAPVHLTIDEGRIVAAAPGPSLMRSWRFAYRAEASAWLAFWEPVPRPGFHDLLALTKRGAARLEGDLHPFLANLQFFKDLLALPRNRADAGRPTERPAA